jgi:hypothetical protein
MENLTAAEKIDRRYSAAMDSLKIVNDLGAKETLTDEEQERFEQNKYHLEWVVSRDFWGDRDLTPFEDAIA